MLAQMLAAKTLSFIDLLIVFFILIPFIYMLFRQI
jgi:hypothetical protein